MEMKDFMLSSRIDRGWNAWNGRGGSTALLLSFVNRLCNGLSIGGLTELLPRTLIQLSAWITEFRFEIFYTKKIPTCFEIVKVALYLKKSYFVKDERLLQHKTWI